MVPVLSPGTLQGKVGARLDMAYAGCGMGNGASHRKSDRRSGFADDGWRLAGLGFVGGSLVDREEEERVTVRRREAQCLDG